MTTTLPSFLSEIAPALNAPLVFYAENSAIRPEYHITEIKLAHVKSLDCGRGEAEWDETLVQLLDGPLKTPDGGSYMSAGKFTEIAGAGLNALGDATDGELFFEFAPANAAARKLTVHSVKHQDESWLVHLGPVTAVCKPALRKLTENHNSKSSCCGAETAQTQTDKPCCAPANDVTTCCSS